METPSLTFNAGYIILVVHAAVMCSTGLYYADYGVFAWRDLSDATTQMAAGIIFSSRTM